MVKFALASNWFFHRMPSFFLRCLGEKVHPRQSEKGHAIKVFSSVGMFKHSYFEGTDKTNCSRVDIWTRVSIYLYIDLTLFLIY